MRQIFFAVLATVLVGWCPSARSQTSAPPATNAVPGPISKPDAISKPDPISKKDADAELGLQKAIADSGNDRAALVHNLKNYLLQFPDAPRKAAVHRALVEACQQLHDSACALDYAERLIAVHPDDSEMMMLAVNLLEKQGDDASLKRASGYVSRVLDRVEKTSPDERPARSSLIEWQDHQNQLRSGLYYLEGQIEISERNYTAAAKDLQASYAIRANAAAAELLGEVAEKRNDLRTAIEDYLLAFVLPEAGLTEKLDRHEVRLKLGNVWRKVYGTENGLGAQILATYDHLAAPAAVANPGARNKDAKDLFAFVVRKLDGATISLAPLKGKVVVLSFWATWCDPCRELEPLFNQVAKNFAEDKDAAFLAVNIDEDESLVAPFVAREKWDASLVFADGLDDFMSVNTLPAVLILDHSGKIVYRTGGLAEGFPEALTVAVRTALNSGK
jgi:thiol-disulfide isomerase/thioredoxin